MTFPVAALTNDIVAPISQSLHRRHTVVPPLTNMSHHPHLGHRYLRSLTYLSARVNNDESPAAKSSNSDRSFPAGPLRSSFATPARAHHGTLSKVRDVRTLIGSHSRTVSTRGDALARIRIDAAGTRERVKPRGATSRFDPSRGAQSERECHPCREIARRDRD